MVLYRVRYRRHLCQVEIWLMTVYLIATLPWQMDYMFHVPKATFASLLDMNSLQLWRLRRDVLNSLQLWRLRRDVVGRSAWTDRRYVSCIKGCAAKRALWQRSCQLIPTED